MIGRDLLILFLFIVALLLSCALTGIYLRALAHLGRLERPNLRSMHTVPVPSGAGVAIVATAVALWPISQGFTLQHSYILLLGAVAGLAAISWIDDFYQLPPALRLAAHLAAAILLLGSVAPDQRILPAVPLLLERMAVGLAWLWFINLFNFMDGIDGLAACEAIAIAVGYAVVTFTADIDTSMTELALIVAAASAGYLVWNWHPAKVFMGDAGSISLGFLLGWFMIDLAWRGLWPAALILPLYFVVDASLTLAARLQRGELPWRPHREHFYQRAVRNGSTPPGVVWRVNWANALLIAAAVLSTHYPVAGLTAAAGIVGVLLMSLRALAGERAA